MNFDQESKSEEFFFFFFCGGGGGGGVRVGGILPNIRILAQSSSQDILLTRFSYCYNSKVIKGA